MKLVNTKKWGNRPQSRELFRIGEDTYYCYIRIGHWAVIKFDHKIKWEW